MRDTSHSERISRGDDDAGGHGYCAGMPAMGGMGGGIGGTPMMRAPAGMGGGGLGLRCDERRSL